MIVRSVLWALLIVVAPNAARGVSDVCDFEKACPWDVKDGGFKIVTGQEVNNSLVPSDGRLGGPFTDADNNTNATFIDDFHRHQSIQHFQREIKMFTTKSRRKTAEELVKKVRGLFKTQEKPLNAYWITSYDQHNNDHVVNCDRRLEFITNYSGGMGNAIITEVHAVLWVDSRAGPKAREELAEPFHLITQGTPGALTESDWLIKSFAFGANVGACGKYVPVSQWLMLAAKLETYDIFLVDVKDDLIEKVWVDRPPFNRPVVYPYPLGYSGRSAHLKLNEVRAEMSTLGVDLFVVTELDEIAWVMNLRGKDLEYSPLFFSFLIIDLQHLHFFCDELARDSTGHLYTEGIRLCMNDYNQFYDCLLEMASSTAYKRIWISDRANYRVYSSIPTKKVIVQTSPIAIEKCMKNDEEAQGMIEAHVYDGYAMCKFFSWLNKAVRKRASAPTETAAAQMMEKIKAMNSDYMGPSCCTVSATSTNTSIVRYAPQSTVNKVISPDDIYLCFAGSQYLSGTTKITRTFCFGNATTFQKECYTKVVKGLINLSTTIFPMNTKGSLLDSLSRQALWKAGLDYNHGTGHGVGAFLNCMEGPIGINRRRTDDIGLLPNMFLTTEPAYYKEKDFGIRVGDVQHLILSSTSQRSDNTFLMFENITLVPYQVTMLIPSQMTWKELEYINAYHLKIRNILAPVFRTEKSIDEFNWLMKMTEPLVH